MLSKRLKAVYDLINENEVVFDVGSDHGLLPCFLVKNKKCQKVYASDNKEGPLNAAITNIKHFHLEGKVIPVLGNGIDNISEDAEIITICGMGYFTVESILKDKDLTMYKRLIVQVNNHVSDLRRYISDHNYTIENEVIVKDDFYYEIIVFNADYHENYSELEIEYGPINLVNKDQVFIDYINNQKERLLSYNQDKYLNKISEINKILEGDVYE